MPYYSHLECNHCGSKFDKNIVQNYCHTCVQPLVAKYTLDRKIPKDIIIKDRYDMWRYEALLPVENPLLN